MADPVITPNIDAGGSPAPPATPAIDGSGVPWENRAAEYKRKLEEANNQNLLYQQELGRLTAPAPPVPADDGSSQYPESDRNFVRRLAQEEARKIAYEMVRNAQVAQETSDPEVQHEAQAEYQALLRNPLYGGLADDAKQMLAVKSAQLKILNAKWAGVQKTKADAEAQERARLDASGATLPGTSPGGQPQTGQSKEEYIKAFMADPEQLAYLRTMYKLDPDSPEGQAKLRRTAEFGWKGSPVSEKLALGIQMLKSGGAQ